MNHLVAVYGSLLSGLSNHHLLDNDESKLLGVHTTEPIYSMYSLGGFPAVQEKGDTPIKIEVYEVSDRVKNRLDGLEGHRGKGNPNNFYDVTDVDTPYGKATMYVINTERFDDGDKVQDGNWRAFREGRAH